MIDFSQKYIKETIEILESIDVNQIEKIAVELERTRSKYGRLFMLGVGGSAGHATHAVNDFRKICNIETYAITDNVCELTARINDEGWNTCFSNWLMVSRLNSNDCVFVLSVGGGNKEKNISVNLVEALDYATNINSNIIGIVGKNGGYTAKRAHACVIIPPLFENYITPHTEGLCSVILHLIVSHPILKINKTKWESSR